VSQFRSSSVRSPALQTLNGLPAIPFEIRPEIDERRYLGREFDPELPLLTKVYSFPTYRGMVGENWQHWHDYYEMILPVEGSGRFAIGEQEVAFAPGDLLIVDTLRLHGVSQLSGPHRSLVVLFPTELVCGKDGLGADAAFLDPMRVRPERQAPLLKATHPLAPEVHQSLLRLHQMARSEQPPRERYTACKVQLLTVLQLLRQAFGTATSDARELKREQARRQRLRHVFDHLAAHFTEPLTVAEVAAVAGMCSTTFREFFKQTTGHTLTDYVRDMRLSRAAELLTGTDQSIADVAAACGFCDQSYLHRCFSRRYGVAPLKYRHQRGS
jgi:AraC-like DNA-binding protein